MTTPDDEVLTYSVEEAARLLGVGPRWLADAARTGQVPHRLLGRRRLFTPADLDAILAARTVGQPEPNPWGLSERSRSRRRR